MRPNKERVTDQRPLALTIRGGYPVSPGYTLIIPRRHVGSFFATTEAEWSERLILLDGAKQQLAAALDPDGFNIGCGTEWTGS